MIRYHKKNLTDSMNSTVSIWKNLIIIGIIITFGLLNVYAEQCCYSTNSELRESPYTYRLNISASHVDSRKSNNDYIVAIAFQQGYTVLGNPFSPFSQVTCSQSQGTGTELIPQYNCESKDSKTFFVEFDLSILPPPLPNSTITPSSVYIFGDKCQGVAFCTDLAEKQDSENSDKIILGPLGTWPKYAVIIGGVILGLTILVACYLVYKRNRPDESYRDRSITPGTRRYENKMFAPNSLLRNDGDDDDFPPDEPPKNTLIQFGSVTSNSPSRSKSVHQQSSSLTKSSTKKKKVKKEKNHDDVVDNQVPSVVIEMSDNNYNGSNNFDRSKSYKSRRNNNNNNNKDNDINNNVNRTSGYSTSDMSKTISINDISDRELSDNNNNEIYSSNTTKKHSTRTKSKLRNNGEESRSERRSSNNNNNNNTNNNNNKSQRHSTLKGNEEDRDGRKVDRTTSRRHRSHSRTRKSYSPPPPASKSTSDLHKSISTRTRQTDRDLSSKNRKSFTNDKDTGKNNNNSARSGVNNLDRKKSKKQKDLISHADTESTTSSSDIPLGDRLPLAMLVTKLPPSGQSNSWKPDDNNNNNNNGGDDDDDTTPLGRISSFGAASTSSDTRLLATDKLSNKQSEIEDYYDSILDEVLGITDYQNSEVDKNSEDEYPIGKSLSNISKEKEIKIINDEEIPIGQLKSG